MTLNEEKNQSTAATQNLAQMTERGDEKRRVRVINLFHVLKKKPKEELNMWSIGMDSIKKSQIQVLEMEATVFEMESHRMELTAD